MAVGIRLFTSQPAVRGGGGLVCLSIPIHFPILFKESSFLQIRALEYLPSTSFFTKEPGCKQQQA